MTLKDYLKETLDLGRDDVFKVDVKEGFSFFNTNPEFTDKVMDTLNNVTLEGRRINVEISKNDGGGRRDHNGRHSGGYRGERNSGGGGFRGDRSSAPRGGGFRSDRNSAPREGGFGRSESRGSSAPRREGGFSLERAPRTGDFSSRAPRRSEGSSDRPRERRPRRS
jgi:ATP-dependent RNA helicase DeaD